MSVRFVNLVGIGAVLVLGAVSSPGIAQTSFGRAPFGMSFFAPAVPDMTDAPRARIYIPTPRASQTAYCVRTCDGRYFPYPVDKGEKSVKVCDAVCPSSEMKLYSGSEIKTATSEQGKPYDKLANAFRFQREMVANCTCNTQMGLGLTPISVRDDRTLRTGDIVAEAKGLTVVTMTGETDRRGKSGMIFMPLSDAKAKALGLPKVSLR